MDTLVHSVLSFKKRCPLLGLVYGIKKFNACHVVRLIGGDQARCPFIQTVHYGGFTVSLCKLYSSDPEM